MRGIQSERLAGKGSLSQYLCERCLRGAAVGQRGGMTVDVYEFELDKTSRTPHPCHRSPSPLAPWHRTRVTTSCGRERASESYVPYCGGQRLSVRDALTRPRPPSSGRRTQSERGRSERGQGAARRCTPARRTVRDVRGDVEVDRAQHSRGQRMDSVARAHARVVDLEVAASKASEERLGHRTAACAAHTNRTRVGIGPPWTQTLAPG